MTPRGGGSEASVPAALVPVQRAAGGVAVGGGMGPDTEENVWLVISPGPRFGKTVEASQVKAHHERHGLVIHGGGMVHVVQVKVSKAPDLAKRKSRPAKYGRKHSIALRNNPGSSRWRLARRMSAFRSTAPVPQRTQ